MCDHEDDPFAGLGDDFDEINRSPAPAAEINLASYAAKGSQGQKAIHEEPCKKCNGSKVFRGYSGRVVGKCFTCKGTGVQRFRTSAVARKVAAEKRAEKKERDAQAKADAWFEANPKAAAWLKEKAARGNNFACSLVDGLRKYGGLTENQMAAVERNIAREAEERTRPVIKLENIRQRFVAAERSGLTRIKIRFVEFTVSKAGPHSINAGALYLNAPTGLYLGKVTLDGTFKPSRDCSADMIAKAQEIDADVTRAAELYGHEVGECSCCGRELTNPESIERGIGPICASKFGF